MSRRHAVLEQRDDIFVLRDNGSSNGTLVNGDKVEAEKTLRDGDLVAIGSARLLFQLDDGALHSDEEPEPVELLTDNDIASASSSDVAPAAKPVTGGNVACPSCGKKATRSDRFCRACGSELEKKTSIPCTACGTTVPLPADFCGHCGHALPKQVRGGAFATKPHRKSELLGDDDTEASRPEPGARQHPRRGRAAGRSAGEPAEFGVRLVAGLVDSMILGLPLLVATLLWGMFALEGDGGRAALDSGVQLRLRLDRLLVDLPRLLRRLLGGARCHPGQEFVGSRRRDRRRRDAHRDPARRAQGGRLLD